MKLRQLLLTAAIIAEALFICAAPSPVLYPQKRSMGQLLGAQSMVSHDVEILRQTLHKRNQSQLESRAFVEGVGEAINAASTAVGHASPHSDAGKATDVIEHNSGSSSSSVDGLSSPTNRGSGSTRVQNMAQAYQARIDALQKGDSHAALPRPPPPRPLASLEQRLKATSSGASSSSSPHLFGGATSSDGRYRHESGGRPTKTHAEKATHPNVPSPRRSDGASGADRAPDSVIPSNVDRLGKSSDPSSSNSLSDVGSHLRVNAQRATQSGPSLRDDMPIFSSVLLGELKPPSPSAPRHPLSLVGHEDFLYNLEHGSDTSSAKSTPSQYDLWEAYESPGSRTPRPSDKSSFYGSSDSDAASHSSSDNSHGAAHRWDEEHGRYHYGSREEWRRGVRERRNLDDKLISTVPLAEQPRLRIPESASEDERKYMIKQSAFAYHQYLEFRVHTQKAQQKYLELRTAFKAKNKAYRKARLSGNGDPSKERTEWEDASRAYLEAGPKVEALWNTEQAALRSAARPSRRKPIVPV